MFFAWGAASVFIILLGLAFLWRFHGGKWRSMRVIEATPVVEPIPPGTDPTCSASGEWLAPTGDGVVSSSSLQGVFEKPDRGDAT
jgi:hypothetical protein